MKNKTVFLLLFSHFLFAQYTNEKSKSINSFVPENWNIILKKSGDLNKDSFEDVAIIIEEQNKNNYKLNASLGQEKLNLNPRKLLILFGDKQGVFKLVDKNDLGFIPSANSEENPCLEDPLLEDGDLEIKNGTLIIEFHYWLSCGSWSTTNAKYIFRHQNQEFELIGFDIYSMHRSSGAEDSTSINFSTKNKITIEGGNVFEKKQDRPKTIKTKIIINSLLKLRECSEETYEKVQNF